MVLIEKPGGFLVTGVLKDGNGKPQFDTELIEKAGSLGWAAKRRSDFFFGSDAEGYETPEYGGDEGYVNLYLLVPMVWNKQTKVYEAPAGIELPDEERFQMESYEDWKKRNGR